MRRFAFVLMLAAGLATTSTYTQSLSVTTIDLGSPELMNPGTAAAPLARRIIEAEDLGTFGGVQTAPSAMNNRGDIVGYVRNAAGNSYDAFLWTRRRGYERIIDNPDGSSALGINDRGDVVGNQGICIVEPNSTSCGFLGFLWSRRDGVRDLGTFYPNAINNRREMAGSCGDTGTACVMRDMTVTPLPSSQLTADGLSINASGDVVGYSSGDIDWGPWTALLWPRDGGVMNLGEGYAYDINDSGTIAGRRFFLTFDENGEPVGHSFARVWTKAGAIEPRTGNLAVAVNAQGWVLINTWGGTAYAWNPRTRARVTLNSSLGHGTYAIDINGRGDIVGLAETGGGGPDHVMIWRLR
jgi:uncharacterized membrane protein